MSFKCNVTVTQILSRKSSVEVEDYTVEKDEDGLMSKYPDEDTDFEELYKEQHYSILQLLDILKKECKDKLRNTQSPRKARYFQDIINDCENWTSEETDVEY